MGIAELNYVDYESQNTGRAYLHTKPPLETNITLESRFIYEPGHQDAMDQGYVYTVSGKFENVTKPQAKALANALIRFSKSGSVLKRGK